MQVFCNNVNCLYNRKEKCCEEAIKIIDNKCYSNINVSVFEEEELYRFFKKRIINDFLNDIDVEFIFED